MDKTKEYYSEYIAMEEQMKQERIEDINREINALESDLMSAWEYKDIDKIKNVAELIESYKDKAEGEQKIDRIKITEECWNSIYLATRNAWTDGYSLASDDIAYYLSQSTRWVSRELEEKLDYIRLIKPMIFFSLNYRFTAKQQQYFCRKKYLYNIDSFKSVLKSNLKEVDSFVPLDIKIELTEDEESRLLDVIEELKNNSSNESDVSSDLVNKIINKDIELLNISAIKDKYLKQQIDINVERMKKKLYLGVKFKIIDKSRKRQEEMEIEEYAKCEFNRLKNTTTVYNQQIYRYLDSVNHTKYYLYFNDNKKPLVLYSIDENNDNKNHKYYIPKSCYHEGIEDILLSKAKIH